MAKGGTVSIILAAGKGTRINSRDMNKVVYPFLGRPMILYGVELFEKVSSPVIVVVGAYTRSVKKALHNRQKVRFAYQKRQLGTGHAVKVALKVLEKYSPTTVLVGMGDHMMFYKKETIEKLLKEHRKQKAIASFLTIKYHSPNELAWGRVERDRKGNVLDIVEQKDATEKQKKIKELNSGFYCFDYDFLRKDINKLKKSKASGEYYLTDIVKAAVKDGEKVVGMPVRFREVGIGINRHEELLESQDLYKRFQT